MTGRQRRRSARLLPSVSRGLTAGIVALLGVTFAIPATAAPLTPTPVQPSASPRAASFAVDETATGWRVTLRTDGSGPSRDDLPVLVVDGRRIGVATSGDGGRTWTATSTDPRVREARTVTLGFATDPTGPPRPKASAGGERWRADGPVLREDPGSTGAYRVETRDYDLGDEAVVLPALGQRSELRGRVYVPVGAHGHRPLVVLLHGVHATCYGPDGESRLWPCPAGQRSVPSYLGYATMAQALASRGYVVMSVSANAINVRGAEDPDAGQRARGQLVLTTLDLVRRGDGGTGALGFLHGRVDLGRIGLMGHSRGGEGVVRATLQNTQRRHPYGIRALFLLAPTNFSRLTVPGVTTTVLLPYCDGDVGDLQGQHYLDDTRLAFPRDRSVKSNLLVLGANHNYFNTEWSPGAVAPGNDDTDPEDPASGCGRENPDRLRPAEQLAVGRAYVAGFFRMALGHQKQFLPLFDGTDARAASAGRAVVRGAFTAAGRDRLDVATLNRAVPARATSGRARLVACAGILPQQLDDGDLPSLPTTAADRPACSTTLAEGQASHWSESALPGDPPGTGVGHLTWTGTNGRVRLGLGRGRDVRRFDALRLLLAPDPAVPGPQDLTLRVTDRSGRSVRVAVSSVSDALRTLPSAASDHYPRVQLRTVRVPRSKLRRLNLRSVVSVELLTDRRSRGAVWVSDVAFTRSRLGRSGPVRLPELRLVGRPVVDEGAEGERRGARFSAVLSRPSHRDVTVEWSALPDSGEGFGLPNQDVTVPRRTGRVRIPAGRTRQTVVVPTFGNDRDGYDLGLVAGLTAASGVVLGPNTGTALIRDDDPEPTLRVSPATATEGSGVLRFTLRLSTTSDKGVGVEAVVRDGTAVRGRDWQVDGEEGEDARVFGSVDLGAVTGTLEVPLLDDAVAEPSENLSLELGTADNAQVGGSRTVRGTITDDD